jgi:hypothetical protein
MGTRDFHPKHPVGHTPGKEFLQQDPEGTRLGIITRVDDINLTADIRLVTGGGDRYEVDLAQPMCGPRSFWGGLPEVNSMVILGFRRKHKQIWEAVILGYIAVGKLSGLRFDPYAPDDPSTVTAEEASTYAKIVGTQVRYKRLRLRQGDVGGMSSSGSEFVLSKDVRMCNRAGDLIELREAERTLVTQAVHRFDSVCGVKHTSGPIRRGEFFLPPDLFKKDGKTLKEESERYFGRDNLQEIGPGIKGAPTKYCSSSGVINPLFNNQSGEYPPVTYSNGRRVYYPTTIYGTGLEEGESGPGDAYVEHRLEIAHDSDLVQEILNEIDGFTVLRRRNYIEQVLGTVVGNDPTTSQGMRQYGKILRPQLWTSFNTTTKGKFTLSEVTRSGTGDIESRTAAGAYLLRIYPPQGTDEDNPFVVAVQKQGKLLVNIPRPTVDRYPDARGVSADVNIQGALKLFLGACQPTNTSLHVTMEGGIKADIGRNKDTGNAIDVTYHCGVKQTFAAPGDDGVSVQQDVKGNVVMGVSGDSIETVGGTKSIQVNGKLRLESDRLNANAHSGASFNVGELSYMVSGKSQYNYGQQVQETIALGGKLSTVMAGGVTQTILAGALAFNTMAGATTFNNPAGAFTVTVGTGGISLTAASGAVAISAGAGAVALTAGAAMTLTASLALSLSSGVSVVVSTPQMLVGGPAAALGVVRGAPVLPPGTPSLDSFTGLPILGSATFRSLL